MIVKNVSKQRFQGLHITKPAREIITKYCRDELNQAHKAYKSLTRYGLFKQDKTHLESAWNKLDVNDTVTMYYDMSDLADLSYRKKGNAVIAETFYTMNGEKVKTGIRKIHNSKEFFNFISDSLLNIIKNT